MQKVSHTVTDAAMQRRMESVSHFYPALVLRSQNRQQLSRFHYKDAKAELQVLTMV